MIIAIIQARMSSARLPGKVLKNIVGQPMLALQIKRILRSKKIDKVVLATSADASDVPLVQLAKALDIDCYQGSLDNVLSRFYNVARYYEADHIVRLTGDCPVTDPGLIDELINYYFDGKYDYCGIAASYPDGLDAEIMTRQSLNDAYIEAKLPSEIEHVTPFINNNPIRYKLGSLQSKIDYSHFRWTVDEKEDFELISKIYEALYPHNIYFTWKNILNFIQQNPDLSVYNKKYKRNEGLQKSLTADITFLERADGSLS